ncbi:protein of unknown function [Candidatus Filomicrobium marinum]|uniref:CYTH domain-containing protein n=2 Tax=Filomicrobium TaxID=119044 RepID=A0A0D6JIF3_9HYPH|nr:MULTISPECIES: hypothetical protein [Filomicrobium]MCV0371442.1 hypothetical protein [Filomicrobium sp.]CFX35917.1 protein of unknown function [Candidatus Filomicrobium marinum]CPR21779.1 protein of unknown function [Candidatus Filomicrobium marinum]SDP64077.1 hypothetical protein SAMN04488061_3585 [Filomicrobium insigne]
MNETTSAVSPARYEFRIFTTNGANLIERLRALPGAKKPERDQGAQTYIVRHNYDHISIKLREDRLEVKERFGQLDCLERWRYRFVAPLPVTADQVEEHLFAPLGLSVSLKAGTRFSAHALIELVQAHCPPLALIELNKDRVKWSLGACNAEYVSLDADGHSLCSIALESTDPNALRQLIGTLQLDHYENQSYIAFLNSSEKNG